MKIRYSILMFAAVMTASASTAKASFVSSSVSDPTIIGTIIAGDTYTVTASGTGNLYAAFNGGKGLTFTADGKPTYDFPDPYTSFYPNGLDYDPSQSSHPLCTGGAGNLCGALLGSFTATPTASDYFTIGSSYTFTATTTGALYGLVNDVPNGYADNSEGYSVNLTMQMSTVPLPASAPMFGVALVALGGAAYGLKWKGNATA